MTDPLRPARGCLIALLLASPLWAIIIWILWRIFA
jgi:hypothetical protein